jgi:hypothetical protein
MKFLLIGRDIGFTTPVAPGQLAGLLEGVYLPSFQMPEKWESEKKATGASSRLRGGAIMMEASSARALKQDDEPPVLGYVELGSTASQTFRSGIEDAQRRVSELKKMASMRH